MANFTSVSSQLPTGVLTSLLTFNITLSFTASLGNVLILWTLYKVSSLQPVTKLLFESLATTDLCVGLFSQPLFVAVLILHIDLSNTNLDILCNVEKIVYISSFVLCGVSGLTSTAISVDRLLVLLLRLRYRQIVTLKRAQAVILLCWVLAVSCGLVRVWSQTVSETAAFVTGLASLVTSVFCYVKIHLRLQWNRADVEDSSREGQPNKGEGVGERATTGAGRIAEEEEEEEEAGRREDGVRLTTKAGRTAREVEEGGTRVGATEESGGAREAKVSPKRRKQERVRLNIAQYKKIVASIFWLQVTLVACYAPFIIVSLLSYTVLSGTTIHALRLFTATLIYLNSSLNPFLYCWKIREVRMMVKKVAKAFCCRLQFKTARIHVKSPSCP